MSSTTMENYYRFQADIYDLSRPFFLFDREKALKEVTLKRGETALDTGCGTGWNLGELVKKAGPEGKIYGLDCSESMLNKAQEKVDSFGWKNVILIKDYAEKYELPEKVDLILFSYSLTMIPDWKSALDNAILHLKDNGKLFIVDFYVWHKSRNIFGIWKKWLKINHVNISDEPVNYLRQKSRSFRVRIFRGGYNYILEASF